MLGLKLGLVDCEEGARLRFSRDRRIDDLEIRNKGVKGKGFSKRKGLLVFFKENK